jgi:hypothetical protein
MITVTNAAGHFLAAVSAPANKKHLAAAIRDAEALARPQGIAGQMEGQRHGLSVLASTAKPA